MKVVIQRVSEASVVIDNNVYNKINDGYLILVGFTQGDTKENVEKMCAKILKLRILEDDEGKMNLSIVDKKGSILSISQFTLYANCKKGNRPSFVDALEPNAASELYDYFNAILAKSIETKVGIFGADMKVALINDGPNTIIIEQ